MLEKIKLFKLFRKKGEKPKNFVIKGVPYYSQWESPNLVRKIIREQISAQADPRWKESGAVNPKEYEFWAKNMCGMACLKMILRHKFGKVVPIVKLGKQCLEYGGYIRREKTIDGLYYIPFLRFIKKEFALKGKILSRVSINNILEELEKGNYVIASVSHRIRNPAVKPGTKGGHLILILGFDRERQIIFFHNPSGDTERNQSYTKISFSKFLDFFARKGMVIENH